MFGNRSCVAAVIVLFSWTLAEAQVDEVIRVDTSLVTVNVAVTDGKSRYFPDLKLEDFRVIDEGNPVRIEFFDNQGPASIVFVIDTSASMQGNKWKQVKSGLEKFLAKARQDNDYTLVVFDDHAQLITESVAPDELRRNLKAPNKKGHTALYDGVLLGLKVLARTPKRHKALVLLSDGEDNKSQTGFSDVQQEVFTRRASIYAIGIVPTERKLFQNEERGKEILNQLSMVSGGLAHFPHAHKIESTLERIQKDLSCHYTLGYYAIDKSRGWRRIQVRVMNERAKLRYQERYFIR